MYKVAFVALGGAVGATLRYLLCLIHFKSDFPFMTLIVNLVGAFAIGIISGIASAKTVNPYLILFLKTGICGGFTTFSTFALETVSLGEKNKMPLALLYAFVSITGCCIGVKLGMRLASLRIS
ncbi:MAG: fluoride efflux transporter CrcB [Ruminococcus sp.]|jgi:CrcB protein|nr:fluoride efflux transporter CrcB [Ruminococcus sp.]